MGDPPLADNPADQISPLLLERARRALALEYRIEGVLGAGSMGIVLQAHHLRLDRPVAIKVLRPEQATAVGTARFLAEARLLARLHHPNVVTVYDAGETGGILYFVMEYLPGETLAGRLRRGPLPLEELERIGNDLLDGLDAAHRLGIIHRDIKPANIFLREDRALLGDFGIARESDDRDSSLTSPGRAIGTPRYMAPEQRDGRPVTSRSDVYAVGLVLWEAGKGAPWPSLALPEEADWNGLPGRLGSALKRALALQPERRFLDAAAFRSALQRKRFPRRSAIVAFGVILITAAIWAWRGGAGSAPAATGGAPLTLAIAPFETGPGGYSGLGDSIASTMAASLGGYPDFRAVVARGRPPGGAVPVRGSAVSVGDSIRLTILPGNAGSWMIPGVGPVSGLRGEWRSVADSLAVGFARLIWEQQPEAVGLAATLPRSRAAFPHWFRGEQLWARAEWAEAGRAYAFAEQQDSTCLLCSYRLLDIGRWLAQEPDRGRLGRLRDAQRVFPPHYQVLIQSALAPLPERIEVLKQAAASYPEFFLTAFEYGDELMHRGPLYGRLRSEAEAPLFRALQLRPTFGPVLEHHAWLLIWKGDSAGARRDLEALGAAKEATDFTAALRLFLNLGFQWRFASVDSARVFTRTVLAMPEVRRDPLTSSGARLMMTLNAPRGAVELGGMLAGWPDNPEAVREGLLAQVFGYAALGRPDSVRVIASRLARLGDPALPLLALELETILRAFDPDSLVRAEAGPKPSLDRYLAPGASRPELRHRAAWMIGLVGVREQTPALVAEARRALGDEPEPRILGAILSAVERGRTDPRGALTALPSIAPLDTRPRVPDPLVDAVIHLLRAEWLARIGEIEAARGALRWHEHMEVLGHGGGEPHAGEPAWALGTLASWLRVDLLADESLRAEQCGAYRVVAEFWHDAPSPFGQRADSARRALASPACRTNP